MFCDTVVRTHTPCASMVRTSGQRVIYSHVFLFSRIYRYCSLSSYVIASIQVNYNYHHQ
jgi:hypothetical protein